MATETEVVQSRFELEGNQPLNELGRLEAKASEFRAAMKGLKKDTEEYKKASSELNSTNKAIDEMRQKLGLTGMTYKQLTSLQRELAREMKNSATFGTEAYTKLEAKLRDVNEVLARQKQGFSLTKSAFEAMKNQIGGVAIGTIVGNGVQAGMQSVVNIIPKYIDGLKKIADQEAQVQKTTGLTDRQYRMLNEQFKTMDTRTPREELRALAAEAGKLGKDSVKDIAEFVREADVINVALGQDLGEGAVTQIGKIADIYQEKMLNIASAVNEVGARSKASEAYQVDFLTRLSGVAPTANLSAAAMLSYGATLENNGQNAELASTALNGFFVDFIKNTEDFGRAAGFAQGELSKLIANKGTNEAFVQFLEKLKGGATSSQDLLNKLQALGIDGARGSNVLLTLANSTGMLREQFDVASKAIQNSDSVMKEFNKNNQNAAGDYEKIAQRISRFFTFESANDGIKNLIGSIEKLTRTELSTYIQREQADLNLLVGAIITTNDEYGTRKRLIEELQVKFPDFLGNLNAETVTNEQLKTALDAVNKEYVKKIFLQKNSEQMQEFAEKEIELYEQLAEQTKQLNKEGKQFRVERGGEVRTLAQDIQLDIAQTKIALDTLKKDREAFLKGQNELAKILGIDQTQKSTDPAKKPVGKTVEPGGSGESEKDKKAREKRLEEQRKANQKAFDEEVANLNRISEAIDAHNASILGKQQETLDAELMKIDFKYQQEIDKARAKEQAMLQDDALTVQQKLAFKHSYEDQIKLLEEQRDAERFERQQAYADKEFLLKSDLINEINMLRYTDQEREIEETSLFYEKKIAMAQKYGLDTTALYEAWTMKVGIIQAKGNEKAVKGDIQASQARLNAARTLYNGFSQLLGVWMSTMDSSGEYAKALAIGEILANQAQAISAAVLSGAKAEAQTPSFGARGAAQTMSVIGIVMSGIAQAVGVLTRDSPSASGVTVGTGTISGTVRPRPEDPGADFSPIRGNYFGGETGSTPMPFGDKDGPFVGGVHANEYVVPSFIRHIPAVVNATGVLEAYRQNAISTGRTTDGSMPVFQDANSSAPGGGVNFERLEGMMMMVMQAVKDNAEKKIYYVESDYQLFKDEKTKIEFLAQR